MQGIDPWQGRRFLVRKRDGRMEEFNEARILLAIGSASWARGVLERARQRRFGPETSAAAEVRGKHFGMGHFIFVSFVSFYSIFSVEIRGSVTLVGGKTGQR